MRTFTLIIGVMISLNAMLATVSLNAMPATADEYTLYMNSSINDDFERPHHKFRNLSHAECLARRDESIRIFEDFANQYIRYQSLAEMIDYIRQSDIPDPGSEIQALLVPLRIELDEYLKPKSDDFLMARYTIFSCKKK